MDRLVELIVLNIGLSAGILSQVCNLAISNLIVPDQSNSESVLDVRLRSIAFDLLHHTASHRSLSSRTADTRDGCGW